MRFTIAGAGLSGLTAAWRLQQAGHDVTVFEARSRVGGRTYSPRLANGVVVNQGARSIRSADHAIRGLCAELELELIGHGFPSGRWDVGLDETRPMTEVDWIFEGLAERVEARWADGAPDEALAAAFAAVVGPEYASHPTYLNLTSALGVPFDRLGAYGFASLYTGTVWGDAPAAAEGAGGHVEHASRVAGGNGRVADALAARLGGAVQLESPVARVAQDADGVELELADGTVVRADAAIVALPLPLLRRLTLDFPLPEPMRRALDLLIQGSNAAISVELATGATPGRASHPVDLWNVSNTASAADELVSDAAATANIGTDRLLDEVLADGPAGALREIAALRPDLSFPEDPDVLVSDWRKDEWSLGSYPNWGIGWDREVNEAFADRTIGRVALAGADTSGAFIGGMDGAVRTAQLAVTQLLGRLSTAVS